MKKLCLSLLLAALPFSCAFAENWIPFPSADPAFIDTDSYGEANGISTIRMKEDFGHGPVVFTLAFRPADRTYKTVDMLMPGKNGPVKEVLPESEPWQKIKPGTFGKNIYTHFIENPIPRFENPRWLAIWHDQQKGKGGATIYIERDGLSYRDGYATFYFKVTAPDKNGALVTGIYHVKMNMAYKKVQALSITDYDANGHITAHGAGDRQRTDFSDDTPMGKLYAYINGELTSGRLPDSSKR